MKLTLKIWRQSGPDVAGDFVKYTVDGINDHMSFLEVLDLLNDGLVREGKEPVAFESDCREGICGACGLWINGRPHGKQGLTTCLLHVREFTDGETVTVEPFRARSFSVIKDLIVDRSSLDRIIEAGGFVSVNTGGAPEANSLPIAREQAEHALDAAACIGCGACVAACDNASASLFTAAKVAHFARLPQGQVEGQRRVKKMVDAMQDLGFGNCTNIEACSAACPQKISVETIGQMNWEYLRSRLSR